MHRVQEYGDQIELRTLLFHTAPPSPGPVCPKTREMDTNRRPESPTEVADGEDLEDRAAPSAPSCGVLRRASHRQRSRRQPAYRLGERSGTVFRAVVPSALKTLASRGWACTDWRRGSRRKLSCRSHGGEFRGPWSPLLAVLANSISCEVCPRSGGFQPPHERFVQLPSPSQSHSHRQIPTYSPRKLPATVREVHPSTKPILNR